MFVQMLRVVVLIGLLGVIVGAGFVPFTRAQAAPDGAIITGWVRDQRTGAGVAGATVQIGTIFVQTDGAGNLPRTRIPIAGLRAEVDVAATAAGYAPWRYIGIELALDYPVELRIELSDQPFFVQPGAVSGTAAPFDGPPDFINVGRTFSTTCVAPPTNVQRIDRVPFMDYVKNVLPNEWVASWGNDAPAALDAGAVAAAQFAWSSAFVARKWTSRGYAFDVVDSVCDQVYKDRSPTFNYTHTDAAVTRMWGTALLRNNKLITTFFRDTDQSCEERSGTADCMGQWGSYYRAKEGLNGLQILHYYYDPVTELQSAPQYRALVLRRSPDVVLWPGRTQTLAVCLRNAGKQPWLQSAVKLAVVDPNDPTNMQATSPFADSSWLSPSRPTGLTQAGLTLGQNSELRFTISAPPTLAPGTYQFSVQPIRDDAAAWLPSDSTPSWTITVAPPTTLTAQAWLPWSNGAATVPAACN